MGRRKAPRAEAVRLRAEGRAGPRAARPRPAACVPLPLGVKQAALQAAGFLSAASFRETARVLAEAALAGTVDELAGRKANVLLGHLVPAGTGFRPLRLAGHTPAPGHGGPPG